MRAFQKANVSILFLALLLCTSASVATGVQVPHQPQIEDLKSDDVGVRRRAAAELAQASTIPSEVIPVLLQLIGDTDGVVGLQSAVALIKSGALPEVDRALQSPDEEVRHRMAEAFSRGGKIDRRMWPLLFRAFLDSMLDVPWYAAQALAHQGPAVLPQLIQAMTDPDTRSRNRAIEALECMGPIAKPAVANLMNALHDSELSVQFKAAVAIAAVEPTHSEAVPILIREISNGSTGWSLAVNSAIDALKSFGSLAQPAIPSLLNLLALNQDAGTRMMAARALSKIRGLNEQQLEEMVLGLRDPEALVRAGVASALGDMVPEANEAIPQLLQALHDDQGYVRRTVAETLAKFGEAAVLALNQASQDKDMYVRQAVVESFRNMKLLPNGAAEILKRMAEDKNTEVREGAASLLRQAGIQGEWEARFELMEKEHNGASASKDASPNPNRLYSKEEIIASIPADADHKYPLELEYLIPLVRVNQVQLPVTLHRGKDRGDLLIIWKQVGDKFQKVESMGTEGPGLSWFLKPNSFHYNSDLFIQISEEFSGTSGFVKQTIFAVQPDNTLVPVQIQDADDWYKDKLKPGETIMNGWSLSATDPKLEFMFYIWNKDDGHCCPTAGIVNGTFKIAKSTIFDSLKKEWFNKYIMSVATANREPVPKR
jgi:HEAT repeat protein